LPITRETARLILQKLQGFVARGLKFPRVRGWPAPVNLKSAEPPKCRPFHFLLDNFEKMFYFLNSDIIFESIF